MTSAKRNDLSRSRCDVSSTSSVDRLMAVAMSIPCYDIEATHGEVLDMHGTCQVVSCRVGSCRQRIDHAFMLRSLRLLHFFLCKIHWERSRVAGIFFFLFSRARNNSSGCCCLVNLSISGSFLDDNSGFTSLGHDRT